MRVLVLVPVTFQTGVTTYGSIFATKGASSRINYTASSGRSYFDLPKRSLMVG